MRGYRRMLDLFDRVSAASLTDWSSYNVPGREGVQIDRLYDTSDTGEGGPSAALVRYLPGAKVKRHIHPGYEIILVIEGELINDTGVHGPGTLEIHPPGSSHALASETGCVFLVVWEQPVELAPAHQPNLVSEELLELTA